MIGAGAGQPAVRSAMVPGLGFEFTTLFLLPVLLMIRLVFFRH